MLLLKKTCLLHGSGAQIKVMNTMFGQMQTQTALELGGLGKVADKIPAVPMQKVL